jgi:hypothetical protein
LISACEKFLEKAGNGDKNMATALPDGIDLSSIIQILNSAEGGMSGQYGYLDVKTGDVLTGSSDFPVEGIPFDEDGEIPEELEHRYLSIPNLGSRDAYQDMVNFIATITDERLRDLLDVAISGKGAFGRFKDVLRREEYQPQQAEWFAFSDRSETARAVEWLAEHGFTLSN